MTDTPQKTVRRPWKWEGPGLHTGGNTRVTINPAPPNVGVRFCRVDLPGKPIIDVDQDHISHKQRRTALRKGDAEVQTVEHLLAPLYMLGVTNCVVEMDAPEIPGLDGSARSYVEGIEEAGLEEQNAPAKEFRVREPISFVDGDVCLVALPHESGLKISYTLDYGSSALQPQFFSRDVDAIAFKKEVAPARTFCLKSEADALLAAGLGKGANDQNTVVFQDDGSLLNNTLRFPDEPCRHKVLDLIGDLSIIGRRLYAHVVATKSGHSTNLQLVKRLYRRMQELEDLGYVPAETRLEVVDLLSVMPHRYPFLLVDRIIEIEPNQRVVGIKNVTFNEPFFQGHFPGKPIMPGVLQVEAMAQTAGALMLPRVRSGEIKLAYLLSIDKCHFRKMVVPGDQLRLEARAERLKTYTAQFSCRGLVKGEVVCEAVIRFMLVGN
ncbi:MAG: UDP-3-O-acyl-N-acetylglucosamine deacetylase [Planctomycetes bacterium]|nr:UDP-3-O-acyl-N-acetylglucosamine deacetylase [Planctomycetota bacterium]